MFDAARLKELREQAQLSAGQLSVKAGLARNAVSRLEGLARGKAPEYQTVMALATALSEALGTEINPADLMIRPRGEAWDWRYG